MSDPADIKTLSGEQLALALQDRYMSIQKNQTEIQAINAEIRRRLDSLPDTEKKELE